MSCATCGSLGYRSEETRRKLKVVIDKSFQDFETSAATGCGFCDLASQSFLLFREIQPDMKVELLLYPDSPTEMHSTRKFGEVIEIYPESDLESAWPTVGKYVPRESTLPASIEFLQKNYEACTTKHDECRQTSSCLPKRLVDISGPRYRLVEPDSGTEGLYAALSYSWGNLGFAMNTSETYEELKLGFDPSLLPVAFQDAAMLARSLNVQYLWIDTLCIIQDSAEDWEDQAAVMGDVFEAATITIAAAFSPDPSVSIFGPRLATNQEIDLFSEPKRIFKDVVFKARRKISRGNHAKTGRSSERDPLDSRAWALQERVLSARLISFTGAELQWKCRALKACECHQKTYPSTALFSVPTQSPGLSRQVLWSKCWSQIIEEYSARRLKHPEDKLPALSGLASKFGAVTGFTYIAGLWKETLMYDLSWQRDCDISRASSIIGGPSFSWVSLPGPVNFRFARYSYRGIRTHHTELIEMHTAVGRNPYGRAASTSLTVRGYTMDALLRVPRDETQAHEVRIGHAVYNPNADQEATCEFSIDVCAYEFDAPEVAVMPEYSASGEGDAKKEKIEREILLLSLYSIEYRKNLYQIFLILVRSQLNSNTYKRIGIGSGKIYDGGGGEVESSSESQTPKAFEWLMTDAAKSGLEVGNMTERVICIR